MFETSDLIRQIRLKQLDIAYQNKNINIKDVAQLYRALKYISDIPSYKIEKLKKLYAYTLPFTSENIPKLDLIMVHKWSLDNFESEYVKRQECYSVEKLALAVMLEEVTPQLSKKDFLEYENDIFFKAENVLLKDNCRMFSVQVVQYTPTKTRTYTGWLVRKDDTFEEIAILFTYMYREDGVVFHFYTILLPNMLEEESGEKVTLAVKALKQEEDREVKAFFLDVKNTILKTINMMIQQNGDIYQ